MQPGPTASFTNTVANCSGNISFTSTSSTNGGAPITTYTWNWGDGTANGSGASATHTFGTIGTNTVTLIISNGTCIDSIKGTVIIPPHPIVNFNLTNNCIGATSNFTSTSSSGAGIASQIWNYGDASANGSGVSVSHTYAAAGTFTVTLVVTDNNACIDSIKKPITIYPLPVISVNSPVICNGGSTTVTANGASTYAWTPPTGLSATTGATVTANPPSTTSYTVTGTDVNGCVNTGTTTVTVSTNPAVVVNTSTICLGQQTATLTASGAGTYTWTPATGLSSTTGSVVTANPGTTTTYTINGAIGTCTAVGTTTVTVNPLPVPVIGSNSPVCVNQTLNLTSGGGTIYSWTGPNLFSSAQQNPSITGVSATATGTYSLLVTDANACTNTATINVLINSLPIVSVTGATVCLGATINLTANGGTGYSWSGPGAYTSNSQNPSITNATIAMTGNYVVVVTDANGCSNANTALVTVNPSLVIAAGSNSPICQNATLNLTASTGVIWVWSGPLAFSSAQQNPSINNAQPNVSGTYTVLGTDVNGCQGSTTINVVVNPLPIVTATSATICAGSFGTMNAGGALTYTWNNGATLSSPSLSPPSTTSYTVIGTDNNNCVNFATSSILVNPLPVVTVNSSVICIGNTTTLTANGAVNYSSSPVTGLSTGVGSIVTANPTSTTLYTITGTDNNLCVNTATTTVTVNPLPNIIVNSGVICAGKNTTLTATGANAYSWTPVTGLSASTGAIVTASPATTSAYTVTGTDLNGCVNTNTLSVVVNPLPLVVVGPPTVSGCAPVCVNFSNTASGTGNCAWSFGNGANSTSCNPGYCFTGQGTFYSMLTLTDANGCVSSDSSMVIVYPNPIADFGFAPQPTTILDPVIHFNDQSSAAIINTWGWTFGDPKNNTANSQNPIFTYQEPGSYLVHLVVTTDHGCKDSINKIVIIAEDYFLYVPNAFSPNSDGINDVFMAKGEGIKDFRLYIFDRWGSQIFFSDDIYKGWDGRYQSKGTEIVQEDVYVWKIECKNQKGEPKMLKGTVSLLK